MKALTSKDLFTIAHSLHPALNAGLIRRMIKFNKKVRVCVTVHCTGKCTVPVHPTHLLLSLALV